VLIYPEYLPIILNVNGNDARLVQLFIMSAKPQGITKKLLQPMTSSIKIDLARELASELPTPAIDLGLRAGLDPLHPLYRSGVATSFATWNVLNLWAHKDIKTAGVQAINAFSESACVSRYLGGLSIPHTTCEARIARFLASDAAVLFASRNQAVLTLVTALACGGGVVIGPAMSTLPLADACALVDLEYIECESLQEYQRAIQRHQAAPRILVFVETISATTGRRIELASLLGGLPQPNAWFVIDESSALAHSGIRGAGSAELLPSAPFLLARLLSAQLITGGQIAALSCSNELRDLLVQRSRYLRSEPPPSTIDVASLTAGLDLIEVALTGREKLAIRSQSVQLALREQGWQVASADDLPLVTLWFESYQQARTIQEALLARGIVVDALTARSIRRNGAVVRIILSSGHTELEVTRLLDSLLEVRKRVFGSKEW
jgi:7-keto-8-aminopelargonate synthetase-like enzyme